MLEESQRPPARLRERLGRLLPRVAHAVISRRVRADLLEEVQTRAMQALLELTRVTNDGGFQAQRSRSVRSVHAPPSGQGPLEPEPSPLTQTDPAPPEKGA